MIELFSSWLLINLRSLINYVNKNSSYSAYRGYSTHMPAVCFEIRFNYNTGRLPLILGVVKSWGRRYYYTNGTCAYTLGGNPFCVPLNFKNSSLIICTIWRYFNKQHHIICSSELRLFSGAQNDSLVAELLPCSLRSVSLTRTGRSKAGKVASYRTCLI